jgi:hypothetical protein
MRQGRQLQPAVLMEEAREEWSTSCPASVGLFRPPGGVAPGRTAGQSHKDAKPTGSAPPPDGSLRYPGKIRRRGDHHCGTRGEGIMWLLFNLAATKAYESAATQRPGMQAASRLLRESTGRAVQPACEPLCGGAPRGNHRRRLATTMLTGGCYGRSSLDRRV